MKVALLLCGFFIGVGSTLTFLMVQAGGAPPLMYVVPLAALAANMLLATVNPRPGQTSATSLAELFASSDACVRKTAVAVVAGAVASIALSFYIAEAYRGNAYLTNYLLQLMCHVAAAVLYWLHLNNKFMARRAPLPQ